MNHLVLEGSCNAEGISGLHLVVLVEYMRKGLFCFFLLFPMFLCWIPYPSSNSLISLSQIHVRLNCSLFWERWGPYSSYSFSYHCFSLLCLWMLSACVTTQHPSKNLGVMLLSHFSPPVESKLLFSSKKKTTKFVSLYPLHNRCSLIITYFQYVYLLIYFAGQLISSVKSVHSTV